MDDISVALHCSAMANRGGTGVYTRRLLQGFRQAGITGVTAMGRHRAGLPRRLFSQHVILPPRKNGKTDLIHLPAFGGKVFGKVPYVVTVHDMAFMANPKWFTGMRSLYYRLHFPRVARGAALIIADSEFTRSEIRRYLGLDSKRVYLSAPVNSAAKEPFRSQYGIRGDYLLYAGTLEPRKNINALMEAWSEIHVNRPDLNLVLAGRWGWGDKSIIHRMSITGGVKWVGPLSVSMLASALAGARLMVYPSLYEGFGLPPLEAAASGVPFVIGPAETLREVYGDVAAGVSGPTPASIAETVLNALESGADSKALLDFAMGFSSVEMAQNTWKCYMEAIR